MPIVQVHLVAGEHAARQVTVLLTTLSARYSEVLDTPLDLVRAFATEHPREHWVTGGVAGVEAPYFTALVLAGRPADQRRRLLGACTDAIVDLLGVERRLVRGHIVQVDPDDWGVGGVPSGSTRRTDVEARAR